MADKQGGRVIWNLDVEDGVYNAKMGEASKTARGTAQRVDTTLGSLARSVGKSFGDVAASVGRIGFQAIETGAFTAIGAITTLGTKGLTSASQLQSLQISMNGLTKSMNLGAEAMAGAYAYAQKAPFQLTEVAATTKSLIAYGLSVKDSVKFLDLLGNVSVTTGVPLADLGNIFGRVSAQGRLMNQDIQQLTENGVAVLPALQKQLGKTTQEIQEMASAGEISFDQLVKAMSSIVDPKILDQLTNTLPRQLDRLNGSFRVLSGSLVGYTVDINGGFKLMSNSLVATATQLVKGVADSLRAPELLASAAAFGQSLNPVVQSLVGLVTVSENTGVSKLTSFLTGFFTTLAELGPVIVPLLALLAIRFSGLFSQVPIVGELIGGLSQSLAGFGAALGSLGSSGADLFIGGIGRALSGLPSAVSAASAGVATFVSSSVRKLSDFASAASSFVGQQRTIFAGFGTELSIVSSALGAQLARALEPAIASWAGTLSTLRNNFVANMNEIRAIGSTVFGPLVGAVQQLASTALGQLQAFASAAVGHLATVKNAISNAFLSLPIGGALQDAVKEFAALGAKFLAGAGPVGNALAIIGQSLGSRFASSFQAVIGDTPRKVFSTIGSIASFSKSAAVTISTPLVSAFKVVGDGITKVGSLTASLASNLAGPLVNGVIAVGAAAATMGPEFGKTVDDIVNKIINQGPQMASQFVANIEGLVQTIVNNAPALTAAFGTIFTTLAQFIITNGPSLIQSFTTTVVTLIQTLATPQNIGLLVTAAITLFGSMLNGLSQVLPVLLQGVLTFVLEVVKQFTNPAVITSLITTVVSMLGQIITALAQALPAIINGLVQFLTIFIAVITRPDILQQLINATVLLITTIVNALLQNIEPLLRAALQLIVGVVKALASPESRQKLSEAGKQILRTLGDALSGAGSFLFDTGKSLIRGLLDGAGSLLKTVGKFFLDSLPGWIRDPFKKALDIRSPSRVFAGFGKNVVQGLVNGISGSAGLVSRAMNGLTDRMQVQSSMSLGPTGSTAYVSGTSPLQATAPAAASSQGVVVNLHMDGIMTRSRSDLREIAKDLISALNEELRSKGMPEIGGGAIIGGSPA